MRISGGPIVEREGHLVAVEIDFTHSFDRFADDIELVERRPEQFSLQRAIDDGDQNDETGMQRLRRTETTKIARVVGDEDKVAV